MLEDQLMKSSLDMAEQIRPRKVAALRNGEMGFPNELKTFHSLSLRWRWHCVSSDG
jgi:hypothetical protein